MRIGFKGGLVDEREIRAGFIGCGGHSFRNIIPAFQFAPVKLIATCDLSLDKAEAYCRKFGGERAYSDYREMLRAEQLDAVFIVTGYNEAGRPIYPELVEECLDAGCHVFIEKPAASTCLEVERMRAAAERNNKKVMVGYKKMFFPANVKAKEIMEGESFGGTSMILLQYPQHIPCVEDFERYTVKHEAVGSVISFLDHLCHPVSLLMYLAGMPDSFSYERSRYGAGAVNFWYESGLVASLALTHASSYNGGMERTTILSGRHGQIVVDNNIKVSYHQGPPEWSYGTSTSFFTGAAGQTTAVWEPEFSLGNLYNKGLFLMGYYNEVKEFAEAILNDRPLSRAGLDHAKDITHIFELFAQGPGKTIRCK